MNELAETADRAGIDFSRPVNLQLRIRNNILLQALRKLRHPNRLRVLRGAMDAVKEMEVMA